MSGTPPIPEMRHGWYSHSAEKAHGSLFYYDIDGAKVVVTLVSVAREPEYAWEDREYRGEVYGYAGVCHPNPRPLRLIPVRLADL